MTRRRSAADVLGALRDSADEMSAAEVAAKVKVSLSTARFHLDHLVADGRVRSGNRPSQGPGRPRLLYRAVPAAAIEDAAAYQLLAELLAEQLAGAGGSPIQAGARWADSMLEQLPRGELDGVDPVEFLFQLLRDSGFDPQCSASAIELRRCPFSRVIGEHAQVVCGVHASLVSAVLAHLGLPAQVTLTSVGNPDEPCRIEIDWTAAPAARLVVA